MSEIAKLEKDILANVAAAKDEAALEAVRIAALGKNGSVSALLKTLGTMSADERKTQGPAINAQSRAPAPGPNLPYGAYFRPAGLPVSEPMRRAKCPS
jgi:phenylalanyl-tRNA synthetase alpha subunit